MKFGENLRSRSVGDCGEMWGIVGYSRLWHCGGGVGSVGEGNISDCGMGAIGGVRTAGRANFHKF